MEERTSGEQFLLDFHARHAGGSPELFARARLAGGESTYEFLARAACAEYPRSVLDLGCGSGYLLDCIAERCIAAALLGIDFSEAEIQRARTRLGTRAELLVASADALPMHAASVDVVVSHLALMLMDRIDAVLAEIARVLRPGGALFAVVTSAPESGDGLRANFRSRFRAIANGEGASFPMLGDPRFSTAAGIRELFEHTPGFDPARCSVEELTLELPKSIASAALLGSYLIAVLSPEGAAELTAWLDEEIAALDAAESDAVLRLDLLFVSVRTSDVDGGAQAEEAQRRA